MKKKIFILVLIVILVGLGYYGYKYIVKQSTYCWPYCEGMTGEDRNEIKRSALGVSSDWVTQNIVIEDKTLQFMAPTEYMDYFSYELISKPMDGIPENFPIDTIGGSVSNKEDVNLGLKTGVAYKFVSSTNYKVSVIEIPVGLKHVEFSYSYKSDPEISGEDWDAIVKSFKLLN